ncbi:hypothetical protein [Anaplasma phagocytophilum]|uniref:hypothetical protein n=1 Tax=Anaplasma phagocytophilum TaxID=948 RepID=UPI00201AD6EC
MSTKGKTYTTDIRSSGNNGDNTAQCSGLADTSATGPKSLSGFVNAVKVGEGKNWPTGQAEATSGGPKIGSPNSNATAVAKDLVKELTPEEKTIVAGLLAKIWNT